MTSHQSYKNVFDALQDAILQGSSVKIKYEAFDGSRTARLIDPQRFILVERQRNKYHRLCVTAYCHLREADRTFAIYRIKKLITS